MHQSLFESAVKGDERPAAARAVDAVGVGKCGIGAVEVAELHNQNPIV